MSEKHKSNLYRLIAGILHLSQIEFEDMNGIVCVRDKNAMHDVSQLFSIDADKLIETLTIKKIAVGNKSDNQIR